MSGLCGFRLPQGGRIDRRQVLTFTFNCRTLQGCAGDTIASALLANGVGTVARSFKYHRPRGILSAGLEEPNALLRVETRGSADTLVRATLQPLLDGMRITSENCFPSVDLDLGRSFDVLHSLWPAGFYHKTFKWPSWRTYEPFMRRAAGLGTLPDGPDRMRGYRGSLHCHVLIVGAGVAGLAAASAAARTGAHVVLMEQDWELGGGLLGERRQIDGHDAQQWIDTTVAHLRDNPKVQLMSCTLVAGYYDHNVLTALDRRDAAHATGCVERFWHVHAREVVLATGAIEQPLVFACNDRPGILLASAARAYLHRYAVAVGRNVVVATNHDDAYRTAFDLHDAGVRVAAIVDSRAAPGEQVEAEIRQRALQIHRSSMIIDTRGSPTVRRVAIASVDQNPGHSTTNRPDWIDCDALAMSSGWNPTVHLYCQAGGRVGYEQRLACLVPEDCRQRVRIVGAANGEFDLHDALASAVKAGQEAGHASLLDDRIAMAPPTEKKRPRWPPIAARRSATSRNESCLVVARASGSTFSTTSRRQILPSPCARTMSA